MCEQCFRFVLSALHCYPWISALHLHLRDIHSPLFLLILCLGISIPLMFVFHAHAKSLPVTLASVVQLVFMPQLPNPHSLVLSLISLHPPHLYPQEQRGGAGKALGGVQPPLSVPAPSWAGNAPSTSRACWAFVQVQRMKTQGPIY